MVSEVNASQVDRHLPERGLLAQGWSRVAGVDEAGRGPLAGPVVAAAVILPPEWIRNGVPREYTNLNDSKQLTADQRESYFELLIGHPEVQFHVAELGAEEIDRWNILQATHRAMRAALNGLIPKPGHALVDGRRVPDLGFPQTAMVKGDSRSYSVAAASVVAKVTRDRFMEQADERWPEYGFARHKGYGTPEHLAALARYGPCPLHRRSFAPLRKPERELFDL
jgi:ribonuclease HII